MTSVSQRKSHAKVRSFQNLIGRTARAGMYTEGSILITDPTLYARRNTYEKGGKYRWHECCDMFSKSKAEPCQSSLLLLVSNLEIGYEGHIEAKWLVKYILEHYAEALFQCAAREDYQAICVRTGSTDQRKHYLPVVPT